MPVYVKVAKSSEIQPGTAKRIEAGGKQIALFNIDGTFHAMDDVCTHRGGPLSEGMLSGAEVTCPWHGAVFDVTTGEVISPPGAPRSRDLSRPHRW
jgi:nitrite reductase (NADH) small subunit